MKYLSTHIVNHFTEKKGYGEKKKKNLVHRNINGLEELYD